MTSSSFSTLFGNFDGQAVVCEIDAFRQRGLFLRVASHLVRYVRQVGDVRRDGAADPQRIGRA